MRPAKSVRRSFLILLGVLATLAAGAGVVFAAAAKPGFTVGVSPSSQSVQQGATATYAVTVTGTSGFAGAVALSASGLPAGATAAFSSATVSPTSGSAVVTSTLTVATTKTTPSGTSSLTITGTNGSTKNAVTAGLTVTYALNGSFSLTASPASVSVAPGSTAVYTAEVTRGSNFNGAVTLGAYGSWPTGTSASFTPNPIPSTGTSSSMQVSTGATTADGTYTLNLVGSYKDPSTGQTTYQYAQVQLVVDSKLSSKPFTISGGSPAGPLAPGIGNQPLNLTLSNPNNQSLPVNNLSVTVSGTNKAGCGASNYAVTQYSGPYPLTLPKNGNSSLAALGIPAAQQPQLKMLDLPTNQDACKGATVNLAYSGSAQGN